MFVLDVMFVMCVCYVCVMCVCVDEAGLGYSSFMSLHLVRLYFGLRGVLCTGT